MSDQPELSIVIASSETRGSLAECLAELVRQTKHGAVEVIVVASSPEDATFARDNFPGITVIASERERLIPELWGRGVSAARGRVIALSTAACIAEKHWVAEILRAHQKPFAAIGGAIENAPGASLVDWAVYFVRYMPYMLPFRAGPMEVPGDNGTYKRAAILRQMEWISANGFWEAEVNTKLRAQGDTLWGDPKIVVYYRRAFTFRGFSRQRFVHGRIFGRMRTQKSAPARRAFYILTSPAIPLVFLARILRNLLRKRRHLLAFAFSFPLTLWFLLCWSVGEFAGLVGGKRAS